MIRTIPQLTGRALRYGLILAAVGVLLWSFSWVATRPFRRQALLPGQVPLTVIHWGDNDEDAIVAGLVADFEKTNPDIKIRRVNPGQSEAVNTKLQTMIAAGDPPDVFYLGFERVADFADKDLLHDLERFIHQDHERGVETLELNDYYPAVLNCFRYDAKHERIGSGTLVGIPKDFTTIGFYYNKDLFRRAGVREPPDDWTWDEFIAAARTIGKLDGCYGADLTTWESMLRVFLWTEGLDFTHPDFKEYYFRNQDVQLALERLRGWFFDEERTLASAKTMLETGEDPFLGGNVGMTGPLGRWKVPPYRTITDFDWDFAPLPHGKVRANGVFTVAWAISSSTEHPQEAWRLVKYLSGPRGQALNCAPGLAIPSLRTVAQSAAFADPELKPERDDVFLAAAEYAQPIDWPADPRYRHQLRVRVEDIFKGGAKNVAEAMDQVQKDWESLRDSNALSGSYPRMPWARLVTPTATLLALAVLAIFALWWRRRPARLSFREELAGLGMASPWFIGFAAFTAFPVVLSLLLAFTRWSGMSTLDHAERVGLDNLRQLLLYDVGFHKSLKVTAWYALLAVPIGQLAALGAAILMNQEVRGIGFYRSAWYLPSVLAGVGVAVLWKWVFDDENGLLNHLLAPVLAWVGAEPPAWFERDAERFGVPAFVIMGLWSVGGSMMIYLAGLKGISKELYEAAHIDGATTLGRWRHVTLPMLSPVIFFNVIIAVIASFQMFTQAHVMTGGGPGDATRFYVLYLYIQAFEFHAMGYASAMAWLLLLIVLVLTLVLMRGSRRFVYYEALRA